MGLSLNGNISRGMKRGGNAIIVFLAACVVSGCSPTFVRDPWDHGSQPRHYDVMMMTTDRVAARSFRSGCSSVGHGNYKAAVRAFQTAVQRDPLFWEARFELARAYCALENFDLALEAFEQTNVLAPGNDYVLSEYKKASALAVKTMLEKAYVLKADGKLDEAEILVKNAHDLEPESTDILFALAELHVSLGNDLLAEHYSQEVLRRNPDHRAAGILLAKLYMKSNNTEEAAIYIDYFARQYPDDSEIRALKAALNGNQPVAVQKNDIFALRQTAAITRAELCVLISLIVKPDKSLGIPEPDPMDMRVVLDIADHWAYEALHQIIYYRIMHPYANHTFRPDVEINRADLADAVFNMVRFNDKRPGFQRAEDIVITDIPLYHAQYESIVFVLRMGIMATDSEGNFNPNNRVSGVEAINVLERVRN